MQSRCKKHCRWNERLRFNHITTLRRRMQVSKSFCGNAKRIKINSVLKVCLESRAFSLFQISLRGYLKKSKISSISTSAAGFYAKSCLCLRNIRHFLCFQIHLSVYYVLRPDAITSGLKFLFAINNKVYSCQRFKKRDKQ